jgi:hypothetical protein
MAYQEALIIKNTSGTSADVTGANALKVDGSAVTQPVSITDVATATNQDEQTTLLTTLNALVEANNALVQMMSQLIGAMNSGAPALRIIPIASVSTAVTGSVTATVSSLTNFGTGIPAKEMADDINNMTVDLCNINNITF